MLVKRTAVFLAAVVILFGMAMPAKAEGEYKLLRQGSQGDLVGNMQTRLHNLGFNPGSVDGIFGPLTKRAVIEFQNARNLQVDGLVGLETEGALGLNLNVGPTDRSYRKDTFESTAYAYDGTTASGMQVQKGVIAVDPNVIPLGTKVWVEGYGHAIAADTGSAVKGNIIDVWLPTEEKAIQWGRKNVDIKIYEE